MKIKIAYHPEEEKQARTVAAMIRHILGDVRIHDTDQHKPFRHLYISTRRTATGRDSQRS